MKVRVQIGHWGRKTGATGAYNSDLKLSEASMNKALAEAMEALVKDGASPLEWEFLGPDVRPYTSCDVFIALHMDGSSNKAADGPSVGFPVSESAAVRNLSNQFAEVWKRRRGLIPGSGSFRTTNYTRALQYYYGYKSSYSAGAKVKVVIENGFVSNNAEAKWAIEEREAVAQSLIDTVHEVMNVKVQTKSVFTNPDSEDENMQLDDYWEAIQRATGLTYSPHVELWQRLLTRAGFPVTIDGLRGSQTENAHRQWCDHVRMPVREVPGRRAWKIMLKALTVVAGDPVQDERVTQLENELTITNNHITILEDDLEQVSAQFKTVNANIAAAVQMLGGRL